MRFGSLCAPEEMTDLAEAGYDFGETEIGVLYPTLDEETFRHAREALRAEPLFPEVVRAPDLLQWAVTADDRSGPVVGELDLRTLFRRAAMVGVKTLVVVAPGHDALQRFDGQARAWREAAGATGLLGEHAARSGLTIAIAPAAQQGGLATSLDEAWVLAEEVGHPAVGVAAEIDTIDDWADLSAAGPALRHIHVPLPHRFGGDFSTERWFEALHALREFGYRGRVSVATEWPTFAERAAELLDELRAAAGRT